MKTFLAQNQLDPNSVAQTPGSVAADTAGALPPPPCVSAGQSESDGVGAKPILASSPSEAVTVSVRKPVAAELTSHIGEIFRGAKALFEPYPIPRLALPRFAPDYEAMQAAVHDPNAPRALETDPVWADEPPKFLRRAR